MAQNEQLASFCIQLIYFGCSESFLSCFCFGIILLCCPLVAVVYEGLITLRFVFTSKGYQRKHKLCFEADKNKIYDNFFFVREGQNLQFFEQE